MDQINHLASILGALSASKLPSNSQINSYIDWLLSNNVDLIKVTDAKVGGELSPRAQKVFQDVRDLLEVWKQILNEKNQEEWIQEFLYETGKTDLTKSFNENTTDAPISQDEASSDANQLLSSLRVVASILVDNVSPELSALLVDYKHLGRNVAADSLEVVEDRARRAKESLREADAKAREAEEAESNKSPEERERDRIDDRDAKEKFADTMDVVKERGVGGIDLVQQSKEGAAEFAEKSAGVGSEATDLAIDRLRRVSIRAREDEEYRNSLHGILDLFKKWIKEKPSQVGDDVKSSDISFESINDPSGHLKPALKALDTGSIQLTNGKSLQDLVNVIHRFLKDINDTPELREFYDEVDGYLRRIIDDYEYSNSEQSTEDGKRLWNRWKELTGSITEGRSDVDMDDPNTTSSVQGGSGAQRWRSDARAVQDELSDYFNRIKQDSLMNRLVQVHKNLGNDLLGFFGLGAEIAAGRVGELTELYGDLFDVIFPRLLDLVHNIPIPRTEYQDPESAFVMENFNLQSLTLLPGSIKISQAFDLEVSKESTTHDSSKSTKSHGTIDIKGAKLNATDISFWLRAEEGPMGLKEDSGIVDLKLPESGFNAFIRYNFEGKETERKGRKTFYEIQEVNVNLQDFDLVIKQSTHKILSKLFKSPIKARVKRALEITLQNYIQTAFEVFDNIAWDTKTRIDVFKDAGSPFAAAVIGGIMSEIGKLAKQSSIFEGIQVTSVGIIKDDPSKDSRFAIGTGPQILPGSKHGPLANPANTSSSTSAVGATVEGSGGKASLGPGGERAKQDIQSNIPEGIDEEYAGQVGRESAEKVQSFKNTVEKQRDIEKGKEGWRSEALNL